MRVSMMGVAIGGLSGAVLGGGPFGLIGMLAGGALGAATGAVVMSLFTSASASEYARHPQMVRCPATGRDMPVTVLPESARVAFFEKGSHARVADCPRWHTHARCNAPCEKDLVVRG